MRVWRWLGAVLSLLWLVGFGGWLWMSSVGDRHEWYALQLQRCYGTSNMDREKLQADAGEYDQRIADISRQYYFCTERVKATFDRQMTNAVLKSGRSWPLMLVRSPRFGCWC
jgi:hypothetical protein